MGIMFDFLFYVLRFELFSMIDPLPGCQVYVGHFAKDLIAGHLAEVCCAQVGLIDDLPGNVGAHGIIF